MMLTISAGFLRSALDTEAGASSTRTCRACSPLRPWATPNSTRAPGFNEAVPSGRALERTKTSPPSSLERKPKPFSTSYHFTLPVGTGAPLRLPGPLGGPLVPALPAYGQVVSGVDGVAGLRERLG